VTFTLVDVVTDFKQHNDVSGGMMFMQILRKAGDLKSVTRKSAPEAAVGVTNTRISFRAFW
jgi:hypothetical protein